MRLAHTVGSSSYCLESILESSKVRKPPEAVESIVMVQHKMVHGALGLRVSEIPAARMNVEQGLQLGVAALQCANNVSKAPLTCGTLRRIGRAAP